MKRRDCTICVAKTKALISCAVTAQLVCALFFPMHVVGFLMWWLNLFLISIKNFQHEDNDNVIGADQVVQTE